MMTVIANRNQMSYGIKHYNVDFPEDIKRINVSTAAPGSTVFVIQDSTRYTLNSRLEWIETKPFGKGSSSSNNGSEDEIKFYDGGSIDGSDPV